MLEWMADGKVTAQQEEMLYPQGQRETGQGSAALAGEGFAVCGVSAAPEEGLWWM